MLNRLIRKILSKLIKYECFGSYKFVSLINGIITSLYSMHRTPKIYFIRVKVLILYWALGEWVISVLFDGNRTISVHQWNKQWNIWVLLQGLNFTLGLQIPSLSLLANKASFFFCPRPTMTVANTRLEKVKLLKANFHSMRLLLILPPSSKQRGVRLANGLDWPQQRHI